MYAYIPLIGSILSVSLYIYIMVCSLCLSLFLYIYREIDFKE